MSLSCFIVQRCWDVALGPLKQIPMNLFIMYMSGNTISIFPIMMVCMMAWRPIQALMSMSASEYPALTLFTSHLGFFTSLFGSHVTSCLFLCQSLSFIPLLCCVSAFKLLESSSQQWLQGLVYLIGNLLGSALAIYKCQSMGLLPTHSSDWLAFIEPPQVNAEDLLYLLNNTKNGVCCLLPVHLCLFVADCLYMSYFCAVWVLKSNLLICKFDPTPFIDSNF